ncbi:hypothetical protein BC832DRAFT_544061 [Gaertneriomyces semiglobifer]|nr:hypothetical protein BC832DRAFT_568469 [Gaertneriomyces semiglobifer]KAI9017274.1 hypothetical protein BC832DRAFT_544061 [Gaertneriomyces semiglobifer]
MASTRQIMRLCLATTSLGSVIVMQGLRKEGRRGRTQILADAMLATEFVQSWMYFTAEMITVEKTALGIFYASSVVYVVTESIQTYLSLLYTRAIVTSEKKWLRSLALAAAVSAIVSSALVVIGSGWLNYTLRTWEGLGFTAGVDIANYATITRWISMCIIDALPLIVLLDKRAVKVPGSISAELGARAIKITAVLTSLSIVAIIYAVVPGGPFTNLGLIGTQVTATLSRLYAAILYNTLLRSVHITSHGSTDAKTGVSDDLRRAKGSSAGQRPSMQATVPGTGTRPA